MTVPRPPIRATGHRVLETLRDHGALTRSRIAELTGLPRPTVVSVVSTLHAAGVVSVDQAEQEPRQGRPSSTVDLAWGPGATVLVDWQRTRLRAFRLDGQGDAGSAVDLDLGALDSVAALAAAITAAWSELGSDGTALQRVVVSVPAPFHSGVQSLAASGPVLTDQQRASRRRIAEWLTTGDPDRRLRDALECPVLFENDANLAALGEVRSGGASATGNAVVVSIKDGIGAGLVLGGRLHRGVTGLAGELAHLQADPNGRLCVCGNRGCLITELHDGPLFASEISAAYGHEVTLPDVMRMVAEGDPGVRRVVSDLGTLIGGPVASVVAWLNLDAVVIDGALGPAAGVVAEGVRAAVRARVTPRSADAVAVRTGLPDGVARRLGAVVLAREAFVDEVGQSRTNDEFDR
jgi:predicted NBD/HSP70 family sugar kinase